MSAKSDRYELSDIELRQNLVQKVFEQRFGVLPALWCRAPGRVDLMGSHTDYNLGYVLTLPIERDTWMAVRPRTDRTVRLYSMNLEADKQLRLDAIVADPQATLEQLCARRGQVLQCRGTRAHRLRRRDPQHGADQQRAEFLGGAGMRDGHRVRGAGRLEARRR